MTPAECLTGIVGLSENECPCTIDDRPEGANESSSGYFLDDMKDSVPLHFPKNAADCHNNNVWDLLTKARKEGINEFFGIFSKALYEFNEVTGPSWTGSIGDQKDNAFLQAASPYVALRLTPISTSKNQSFQLEKVHLYLMNDEVKELTLYKNGDLINTFEITLTNGKGEHVFTTPLQLPLYDTYGDKYEYELRYHIGTNRARNYKLNCACPGMGTVRPWEKHIYAEAIEGLTEDTLGKSPFGAYTFGLRLFGTLQCMSEDWMCNIHQYKHLPFFNVFSKCLQLVCINKLLGAITNSNAINRYTMMDKERIYGRIQRNEKKLNNDMIHLALSMPAGLNNCIKCKDKQKVTVTTIEV